MSDTFAWKKGIRHDLDFGPHRHPALHDRRHAVCALVDLRSGVRRAVREQRGEQGHELFAGASRKLPNVLSS